MTSQALTIPFDITWRRFAYSRDMIDTNFKSALLPPKWRSSMAVYSYVVPAEQTAESYPGSRILYLRLTCSLTGWNPNEELREAVDLDEAGDELDDLQHSSWQAIQSEGWADQYWPCLGAIAQLAVFPSEEDEVGPDEFPFILDVEPKKRELYETRSETGEFMSGSSDTVNVRKGTTTTESTEEADIETGGGLSIPVPIPGVGIFPVGGNVSGEWGTRDRKGTESVDMTTTDSSREKRETLSSTTTFSQLYQLMNAYHLGTNRCVLLVAPRPHTATSATEQVDFNLLKGARALEGIQDFFVIVQAPSTLKGLCIQATLETGHTVNQRLGVLRMRKDDDFDIPDDIPDFDPPPAEEPDDPLPNEDPDDSVSERLVITRRTIANCGLFDESGELVPVGADIVLPDRGGRVSVVGETTVAEGLPEKVVVARTDRRDTSTRGQQMVADQRNRFHRRVMHAMLSNFTARRYKPRRFIETTTARSLAQLTLRRSTLDTNVLEEKGLVTRAELKTLGNPRTLGEIFEPGPAVWARADLISVLRTVRGRIVDFVMEPARARPPQ
jgi:hypothetical protein